MSETEPLLSIYEIANLRAEVRKAVQSVCVKPLSHRQLYAGGIPCEHRYNWRTFVIWLTIDRTKAPYSHTWENPEGDYEAFRPTEEMALKYLYYGEPPPASNTAAGRIFRRPPRIKKSKILQVWKRNGHTRA